MKKRRTLAVIAVVSVMAGLVACGASDPRSTAVVVHVGPYAITKEMVDRVINQEALEHSGPHSEHPGPSRAVLFRDGLSSLISYDWVIGEATERGVNPSQGELDRELERLKVSLGSKAKFQAFLKELEHGGKNVADLLLGIRVQIATQRLLRLIAGNADGRSQQQATAGFVKAWRAKWLAKTHCAAGYVVEKCANYSGARAAEDPYSLN